MCRGEPWRACRKRRGPAEPTPYECPYFFLRTTLLCTLKPFAVGLTHGTVLISGRSCSHTAGAAPGAATARARKNVPILALNANVPFAATLARPTDLRPVAFE